MASVEDRAPLWAELFRCATPEEAFERLAATPEPERDRALAAWQAARDHLAEAEGRLEARARDLEALQAFGRGLAEARTIAELFEATARGAERLLAADAVVIASTLSDRPSLRVWVGRPLAPEDARRLAVLVPAGLLPADTPVVDEEPLPSFDRLQGVRPTFEDRDVLAVPVARRGREVVRIGALLRSPGGERELRVIFGAASHVALHLDRVIAVTEAEQGRFRAILDSMPHAVVLLDAAFQIAQVNASAEPLLARLAASDALRSVGDLDLVGLAYEILAGRRDASGAEASLTDGTRLEVTIASWRDPAGGEDGLVVVLQDVTTAVALREQVARSERLSGLGRLLAGVAHELNNPLTAVIGYAQLIPAMAPGEKLSRRLDTMRREAERCRRIVGGLLRFARTSAPERRAFSLNQVVADAAQLLAYSARSQGVGLELDLDPTLPAAIGDTHELEQAVVNLVSNAQQAIAGARRTGTVTLRTCLGASGGLVLEVEDDGPGIPEPARARIFDPFFTTKAAGQGTGLGLWLVYNAVTAHGGKIAVSEGRTGGALFRLELPRGDAVAAAASAGADDLPLRSVSARILVADPEMALAELICEALATDGHEAVAAKDGDDALARLATEPFDLVISDALLPGLSAERLATTIERDCPELRDRLLLTTGDWVGGEPDELATRFRAGLLRKPFEIDELRWAVRRRLA
jgi:signal transduction histidine kinase/CheY-like chemotaxis protein